MVEVSNSLDAFSEIIEREIHHNRELLKLLREEQQVLTSSDIQAIEMNIRDQDHVIGMIKNLEDSRLEVVKIIAQEYSIQDENVTFNMIIDAAGSDYSERLRILKEELTSVVMDIAKINMNNNYLIENGLAFIEENIKVFYGANEKELLYRKEGGKSNEKNNMYRIVDKRI